MPAAAQGPGGGGKASLYPPASCAAVIGVVAAGVTPHTFELEIRPVSDLINTPNVFSVMVAVLAGIVGILSLTESRASTLIGVFISVTTIPAAADIGLSISYASWKEAWVQESGIA